MKIAPRQINDFLNRPDENLRVILVYGPDQGLVRERAEIISKTIVADINDPFNAAHLTGSIIEEDPSRFFDEVNAQSLMGGTRLIRITGAGNKISVHLKDWLKTNPPRSAVVVVEGGALGPRDSLRKTCEEADNAGALPCYIPDEKDNIQFIRGLITDAGKNIESDAVQWLGQNLNGDRSITRQEINKLCIYAGDNSLITLHDAREACGDANNQSIDSLIEATFNNDPLQATATFRKLMDNGTQLIVILRSLQNHLRRVHMAKINIEENGLDVETAMKKLHPPVFYKQEPQFRRQLNRFSGAYLRRLLGRLAELEAKTKQTATPSEILTEDAILKLASL